MEYISTTEVCPQNGKPHTEAFIEAMYGYSIGPKTVTLAVIFSFPEF